MGRVRRRDQRPVTPIGSPHERRRLRSQTDSAAAAMFSLAPLASLRSRVSLSSFARVVPLTLFRAPGEGAEPLGGRVGWSRRCPFLSFSLSLSHCAAAILVSPLTVGAGFPSQRLHGPGPEHLKGQQLAGSLGVRGRGAPGTWLSLHVGDEEKERDCPRVAK